MLISSSSSQSSNFSYTTSSYSYSESQSSEESLCLEKNGPISILNVGCNTACVWLPPAPDFELVEDITLGHVKIIAPSDIPEGKTLSLEYRKDGITEYLPLVSFVTAGDIFYLNLDPCTRYFLRWVIE